MMLICHNATVDSFIIFIMLLYYSIFIDLEFEIFCTLIFNVLKIGLMIKSKKLLIYDLKIKSMIKNIINPNFENTTNFT